MWFRIKGYGLSIRTSPLLFSERNGYQKIFVIGKYKIKVLRPENGYKHNLLEYML